MYCLLGYFGLERMLVAGNINNARDEPFLTCTDDSSTFPDAFDRFMNDYGICNGFVFIRASSNNGEHAEWCAQLKNAVSERDHAYFEWNTKTAKESDDILYLYENCLPDEAIFNECKVNASTKLKGIDAVLGTLPPILVFIFIKGFLKAGKTIDTTNVVAVIDLPIKGEGHVDSLVQGLVGRCCGYGKNTDVIVFTDEQRVQAYIDWLHDDIPTQRTSVSKHSVRSVQGDTVTKPTSAYFSPP
jgi:hypothetical protein